MQGLGRRKLLDWEGKDLGLGGGSTMVGRKALGLGEGALGLGLAGGSSRVGRCYGVGRRNLLDWKEEGSS